MTSFSKCLSRSPLILTEGAISERLRRDDDIEIHPQLFNTPLIYTEKGREALSEIYGSYRKVAENAQVPLLLCAPTWRIDKEQTRLAKATETIIEDAVGFMVELADSWQIPQSPVFTGALLAPKNDCYRADLGLNRLDSAAFHSWQIEKIANCHNGVIIAQTMPAVEECLGMADILSQIPNPYILSFVTDSGGKLLDGTPLWEAIQRIDDDIKTPPTAYMVNCVYPSFIQAEKQPPELFDRLLGIQANASSKSHSELDGAETLQQDPLHNWGENMLHLHHKFGFKILGGCCGTDDRYLQYLVDQPPT